MAWPITIRGARSSIELEWRCPEHGVFTATVARPEPDAVPCPTCGASSPWTITEAPAQAIRRGQVRRGKAEKPDHPMAMDTSALGEGMPYHEWKAERAKKWADWDHKQQKAGGA